MLPFPSSSYPQRWRPPSARVYRNTLSINLSDASLRRLHDSFGRERPVSIDGNPAFGIEQLVPVVESIHESSGRPSHGWRAVVHTAPARLLERCVDDHTAVAGRLRDGLPRGGAHTRRHNPASRDEVIRAAVLRHPDIDLDVQGRAAGRAKRAAALRAHLEGAHRRQKRGHVTPQQNVSALAARVVAAEADALQPPRDERVPLPSTPDGVSAIVAKLIADMDARTKAARTVTGSLRPALRSTVVETDIIPDTQTIADALAAIAALERDFARAMEGSRSSTFKDELANVLLALDSIPSGEVTLVRRARRRLVHRVLDAIKVTRRVSFQLPAKDAPAVAKALAASVAKPVAPTAAVAATPPPSAIARILALIADMERDFGQLMAHSNSVQPRSFKRELKAMLHVLKSIPSRGVLEVREARNKLYLRIVEAYLTMRRIARDLPGPEAHAEAVNITKVVLVPAYEASEPAKVTCQRWDALAREASRRDVRGNIDRVISALQQLVATAPQNAVASGCRARCTRWPASFANSDGLEARRAAVDKTLRAIASTRRCARHARQPTGLVAVSPLHEVPLQHVVPTLIITPPEEDVPQLPTQDEPQQDAPSAIGAATARNVVDDTSNTLPSPVIVSQVTAASPAASAAAPVASSPMPLDVIAGVVPLDGLPASGERASSPTSTASSTSNSDWEDAEAEEDAFEVL